MEHPHPDKLHVLRCDREFILAFKRKNGNARSLVHYKDFIQTYLACKRKYFKS